MRKNICPRNWNHMHACHSYIIDNNYSCCIPVVQKSQEKSVVRNFWCILIVEYRRSNSPLAFLKYEIATFYFILPINYLISLRYSFYPLWTTSCRPLCWKATACQFHFFHLSSLNDCHRWVTLVRKNVCKVKTVNFKRRLLVITTGSSSVDEIVTVPFFRLK